MEKKRGRPKSREAIKSQNITFWVTEKEMNRIQWLADIYAGGNLSLWLRHAALNADRKFLVPRKRGK